MPEEMCDTRKLFKKATRNCQKSFVSWHLCPPWLQKWKGKESAFTNRKFRKTNNETSQVTIHSRIQNINNTFQEMETKAYSCMFPFYFNEVPNSLLIRYVIDVNASIIMWTILVQFWVQIYFVALWSFDTFHFPEKWTDSFAFASRKNWKIIFNWFNRKFEKSVNLESRLSRHSISRIFFFFNPMIWREKKNQK